MPDVYTSNPQKLKMMLSESGFTCGVQSRILKPRDPNWTCIVNHPTWYGDIYIHDSLAFTTNPLVIIPCALAFVLGMTLGYFGSKRINAGTG